MVTRAAKEETLDSIKQELENVSIALIADYRGLTVAEMTNLRRDLYKQLDRKNGKVGFRVIKNTLLRQAVEGTGIENIGPFLKGPTAVLYTEADPVVAIKTLKEFFKKNKKENQIRGAYLDGEAVNAKQIDQIASLPSFIELRGQLLGGIASPLTGLVMSLSGPQRALVNVLDQYAKQKQG